MMRRAKSSDASLPTRRGSGACFLAQSKELIYDRNQTKKRRTGGKSSPPAQEETGPRTDSAAVPPAPSLRKAQRQKTPENESGPFLGDVEAEICRRVTEGPGRLAGWDLGFFSFGSNLSSGHEWHFAESLEAPRTGFW